jgi:hypothetical protein
MEILRKLFRTDTEKRRFPRYTGYVPASLVTPKSAQMIEIYDLSKEGCGISAMFSYQMEEHDIVQLQVIYVSTIGELYVSSEPINGVIVRKIPYKRNNRKSFGVRFLDSINNENALSKVLIDLEKSQLRYMQGGPAYRKQPLI